MAGSLKASSPARAVAGNSAANPAMHAKKLSAIPVFTRVCSPLSLSVPSVPSVPSLHGKDGDGGANHVFLLVAGMAWLLSPYSSERMIAEELRRLGWSERDLAIRRKNDPDKLAIAVRLRRETTLSIKTIAARVHLGTSNTANARLHRAMKELVAAGSGQGAKSKEYMV